MTDLAFDNTRRYVLGLGCERGAPADEALGLALTALQAAGVEPMQLAGLASIDARSGEPAILAVAAHFGLAVVFFDAARLEEETPRIKNPSAVVFAKIGCHGVAESAALASIGPGAALILPKIKSAHATAAIAHVLLQKE
jgi:cobalamin biosynthesis protein CbiG